MIKAANKFYVLRALGQTKETQGGIIIQHSDETELAEVTSVGPDCGEHAIAVGAHVIINWNSVMKVKVNGKEAFMIHADNILGTVEDEPTGTV